MISIQLADKLYRENGIVTIFRNGKFVKFAKHIEKASAANRRLK